MTGRAGSTAEPSTTDGNAVSGTSGSPPLPPVPGVAGGPPFRLGTPGTGGDAVVGLTYGAGKAGVLGLAPIGNAVAGISDPVNGNGTGVFGEGKLFGASFTSPGVGVLANSTTGNAVNGTSAQISDGVVGVAQAQGKAGVLGLADNGYAIAGISKNQTGIYRQGGKYAAYFEGIVIVTGDVQLTGGDCAEQFDIADADQIEPGTVVVIEENGALRACTKAYDRRVAGVISGAGDYRPAIVLDKRETTHPRTLVALVGKVHCKVDASSDPIEVGDLLTASSTPGHAMKASDPARAFGAVIGKALRPLHSGTDLIPILVALQ